MSKKLLQALKFDDDELIATYPEKLNKIETALESFQSELDNFTKFNRQITNSEKKKAITLSSRFKELRKYAVSEGGLLSRKLRKKIYIATMKYMYIASEYSIKIDYIQKEDESKELSQKKQEVRKIIRFDCQRSVLNQLFPDKTPRPTIETHISELESILNKISSHRNLYYYQGLHDVTLYFHYILGKSTINFVSELCYLHLHEFAMEYSCKKFEYGLVVEIFKMVFTQSNPKLNNSLSKIAEEGYFYCCSLILTWFTHDSKDMKFILRVFDYLVLSPPLTIYFLVSSSLTSYVESNNFQLDKMESSEYFTNFTPASIVSNSEQTIDKIIELSENYRLRFDFSLFKDKFQTKILSQ